MAPRPYGRSFVDEARSELVSPLMGPPDESAYRDPERDAAKRRLGITDDDVIDLTPDDIMSRPELSGMQEYALSNRYAPQELQRVRDEIDADPQAFGAGRLGKAIAEFGGKKYKMQTMSGANTRRAGNWMQYERTKKEADDKRAAEAAKNAVDLAKANIPLEVAKVGAGADEKRFLAEQARYAAQEKRLADETTRRNRLEDEQLALRKDLDVARSEGGARDIREQQTAKQQRIAEKLARVQREELTGLEFNPDEQRAIIARLGGSDPDFQGLTDEQFLRRPSAEMAEREYAAEISKVGQFLEDNWADVSGNDVAKIKRDIGGLVARAKQDLSPGQFARFKQRLNSVLGQRITPGWFDSDTKRTGALRGALGL